MTKQKLQLTIALVSLIAALALAATWDNANAASDTAPCTEYCDSGAQFIADYAKVRAECNGDWKCINNKLEELGWKEVDRRNETR